MVTKSEIEKGPQGAVVNAEPFKFLSPWMSSGSRLGGRVLWQYYQGISLLLGWCFCV
jgi:hypothetical protein